MANTYTALCYHIIFSTKNREPWLVDSVRERVWRYIGGIARENGMHPVKIGGVADHVHALVSIPVTLAVAKAVQLIKGGSSHWIQGTLGLGGFAWQDGYGAFTVSRAALDPVKEYIENQSEHHRTKSFADEYREFLRHHDIQFDERYLLG